MELSRNTKIALGALALGVGYVVFKAVQKKPSSSKKRQQNPVFKKAKDRSEPSPSWYARWEQARDLALEYCQADPDVTSYAEAQLAALCFSFPEAAPWGGGTDQWEPWMFEAKQAVREEIRAQTMDATGGWGAPGWQFVIWLMFEREFWRCYEKAGDDVDSVTECLAKRMYPGPEYAWPPAANAPKWQHQFWEALRKEVILALSEPQSEPVLH